MCLVGAIGELDVVTVDGVDGGVGDLGFVGDCGNVCDVDDEGGGDLDVDDVVDVVDGSSAADDDGVVASTDAIELVVEVESTVMKIGIFHFLDFSILSAATVSSFSALSSAVAAGLT